MSCIFLCKSRSEHLCRRRWRAISLAACIACLSRQETNNSPDIRQHPNIVHGPCQDWNAELLLRVAKRCPPATVPYK